MKLTFYKFAKIAGAKVIATTSSAEKSDHLKKLGADHVINYKENPNWGQLAKNLTPNGEGVSLVVEVGGASTSRQVCCPPQRPLKGTMIRFPTHKPAARRSLL
jgi:NADPH:quinone reductase-like Zn-dependent oxidoreductase